MRNCPTCNHDNSEMVKEYQNSTELRRCRRCKSLFVDAPYLSQDWLSDYYKKDYSTADLTGPDNDARLNGLALKLGSIPRHKKILDIGGEDRQLQNLLYKMGFLTVDILGPGETTLEMYHVIILSHVLEHIYNPGAFLEKAWWMLYPIGRLIIEIPYWKDYNDLAYDYHWQHVNKFTIEGVKALIEYSGFKVTTIEVLEDFREYHCLHIEAEVVIE